MTNRHSCRYRLCPPDWLMSFNMRQFDSWIMTSSLFKLLQMSLCHSNNEETAHALFLVFSWPSAGSCDWLTAESRFGLEIHQISCWRLCVKIFLSDWRKWFTGLPWQHYYVGNHTGQSADLLHGVSRTSSTGCTAGMWSTLSSLTVIVMRCMFGKLVAVFRDTQEILRFHVSMSLSLYSFI